MILSSSPALSARRTAELRAAVCSNLPAIEKGGEGGEGESTEEGGVVVCIYRELSSQRNFLVPPSGTVSSFRNTDFGSNLDG